MFFGLASARSYKIGVVGNNWLVDNAVFSETAPRIFLIFCITLGDYKGKKVTEPDFWKKFFIWRYWKGLQISPKSDTLIFFSKTALMIFWVFGLKLILNMIINLNETYFWENFAIWTCLTSKLSKKNCPNWGFWPFSWLCVISFHRWAWWFLTIHRSFQCILVLYFFCCCCCALVLY